MLIPRILHTLLNQFLTFLEFYSFLYKNILIGELPCSSVKPLRVLMYIIYRYSSITFSNVVNVFQQTQHFVVILVVIAFLKLLRDIKLSNLVVISITMADSSCAIPRSQNLNKNFDLVHIILKVKVPCLYIW